MRTDQEAREVTGYTLVPFSGFRRQMTDWMELMRRRRTIHGLLEVDVTEARRAIREYRTTRGVPLSFTGFVAASLARAVAMDRRLHAYRVGRDHLLMFDDVDVALLVERDFQGTKVPAGCVIRAADKKALGELQDAIRTARDEPLPWARAARWLPLWLLIPAALRRWLLSRLLSDPWRRKRLSGTVALTAIGMFGTGPGWGIPLTDCTLCLTVGGIARKPWVVPDRGPGRGERVEVREILALTISLDHDVVDGAPAARFGQHLREIIESAAVLRESEVTPAA
jgi:pyruvate/2-oxoglutarate dehydrogenase complex dihydrolipoamide acyltransferase (E2) component